MSLKAGNQRISSRKEMSLLAEIPTEHMRSKVHSLKEPAGFISLLSLLAFFLATCTSRAEHMSSKQFIHPGVTATNPMAAATAYGT